jgi:hypothetical protein
VSPEVLLCVSDMVIGLGGPFHEYVVQLIEPMLQSGLTPALIDTLTVVSDHLPTQRVAVQQRLLEETTKILGGQQYYTNAGPLPDYMYSWGKKGSRAGHMLLLGPPSAGGGGVDNSATTPRQSFVGDGNSGGGGGGGSSLQNNAALLNAAGSSNNSFSLSAAGGGLGYGAASMHGGSSGSMLGSGGVGASGAGIGSGVGSSQSRAALMGAMGAAAVGLATPTANPLDGTSIGMGISSITPIGGSSASMLDHQQQYQRSSTPGLNTAATTPGGNSGKSTTKKSFFGFGGGSSSSSINNSNNHGNHFSPGGMGHHGHGNHGAPGYGNTVRDLAIGAGLGLGSEYNIVGGGVEYIGGAGERRGSSGGGFSGSSASGASASRQATRHAIDLVLLALKTLGSLSISESSIVPRIQHSVLPFLTADSYYVRKEAALTCVKLLVTAITINPSRTKGPSSALIEVVVERLLAMMVSDMSAEVREEEKKKRRKGGLL